MSIEKTIVVEHLDPELEEWSALEYQAIARECRAEGAKFMLTSVPTSLQLPPQLQYKNALQVEHDSVETLFGDKKQSICLLDPAAEKELAPTDGDKFDVFLFGGILGIC